MGHPAKTEMANKILGTSAWVGSFPQIRHGGAVLMQAPIFQFKRTG
jgi:hypothetical protein